jgi:hypothetical protein
VDCLIDLLTFTQRFLAACEDFRFEIDDPVEVEDDLLVVEQVATFAGATASRPGARRLVGHVSGRRTDLAHDGRSRSLYDRGR